MNVRTLLCRRRMFVLLGADTITVFSGRCHWRGYWLLSDIQTNSTPADLSVDFLGNTLRAYRNQHRMHEGCHVHWFLPPDMLAVAFLPSDKAIEGLILPFQADQVHTTLFDACEQGEVWLWMHQSWASLLQRAADQAQCHTLYVHPRVILVPMTESGVIALAQLPDSWNVVKDGAYLHIFKGNRSLRSLALDSESTAGDELQADLQAVRLNLETESIITAWTGGALDNSVPVCATECDVDEALVGSLTRSAQTFPSEHALNSNRLHAGGLLLGSLASEVQRQIWMLVAPLMLVMLALMVGAYIHYHQAGEVRDQAIQTVKKLAPDVRRLPKVKQDIQRKEDFLSVADQGLKTPDVLKALGSVVDALPVKATLHTFTADDVKIEVQVSIAKGSSPPKALRLKDSAYAELTLQPNEESRVSGQMPLHIYQAPVKVNAP